ncbi:uncharacterized protein EDB91DRAFT_1087451 [Suillus paluster]|uniref:uncharacterized protein n=1 Tax=Suillus paluster TaxID=48578 RepID=UPI001B878BA3|nr:uncharacterized protein EDB91DRAFT_1087451 [Suillus paluster]KAG1724433.1 hypothetical protein EDB91DRAFT_1087451 [Suillus paluster]
MFARLSTGFCVLLGLTALLDVNAGVVPVSRNVGVGTSAIIRDVDLDKRTGIVVGNNPEPDHDPGKKTKINLEKRAVVGNDPEPDHDPGKKITVDFHKRAIVGNDPEPDHDPGKKTTVDFHKRAIVGNNPEPNHDPGKKTTVDLEKRAVVSNNPEPENDPGKKTAVELEKRAVVCVYIPMILISREHKVERSSVQRSTPNT